MEQYFSEVTEIAKVETATPLKRLGIAIVYFFVKAQIQFDEIKQLFITKYFNKKHDAQHAVISNAGILHV